MQYEHKIIGQGVAQSNPQPIIVSVHLKDVIIIV